VQVGRKAARQNHGAMIQPLRLIVNRIDNWPRRGAF